MKKRSFIALLILVAFLCAGCGRDINSEILENLGGIVTVSLSDWKQWCETEYDNLTDEQKSQYSDTWLRMSGYLVYEKGEKSGKLYPSEKASEENAGNSYTFVYFDKDYLPDDGGQVVVVGQPSIDFLMYAQVIDNIQSTPRPQAETVSAEMFIASFDDMTISYSRSVYDTGRIEDSVYFMVQDGYDQASLGNRIIAVIAMLKQRGVLNYTILVSSNPMSEAFLSATLTIENGNPVSQSGMPAGVFENTDSEKAAEEAKKIAEQWDN